MAALSIVIEQFNCCLLPLLILIEGHPIMIIFSLSMNEVIILMAIKKQLIANFKMVSGAMEVSVIKMSVHMRTLSGL